MSEIQEDCLFDLDAALTMARLLGEGAIGGDLFERLSDCAQGLVRADGRTEITCRDLRLACDVLRSRRSAEQLPA
ncbi:MAG TPA: hypothetical protein VHB53_00465 [Solirubrobacterales bacterium]|nr:hypothetical protein [Solirubrobacterales bacterium]